MTFDWNDVLKQARIAALDTIIISDDVSRDYTITKDYKNGNLIIKNKPKKHK